jgi:broad specificity polyphosphatase/5'/3'-nucleotidase SurE
MLNHDEKTGVSAADRLTGRYMIKKAVKKKRSSEKKEWYWNKSCRRVEKASDKDIQAGRIKRCMSASELKKDLCK